MGKFTGITVYQFNTTIESAKPHIAFVVFANRINRIIAEAGCINFILLPEFVNIFF